MTRTTMISAAATAAPARSGRLAATTRLASKPSCLSKTEQSALTSLHSEDEIWGPGRKTGALFFVRAWGGELLLFLRRPGRHEVVERLGPDEGVAGRGSQGSRAVGRRGRRRRRCRGRGAPPFALPGGHPRIRHLAHPSAPPALE